MGSVWFLVGMLVRYLYSRTKAEQKHETYSKQRISELQVQGVDLYYERKATLTPENIKKVRSTIGKLPAIFLVIALVGCIIIYLNDMSIIAISIFVIALFFISYGFYLPAKRFINIITNGTKTILRGIIVHRHERYPNDDSDSLKQYFFSIGEREIQVDLSIYQEYKLGDAIELHYVSIGHNASPFILNHWLLQHADAGISVNKIF